MTATSGGLWVAAALVGAAAGVYIALAPMPGDRNPESSLALASVGPVLVLPSLEQPEPEVAPTPALPDVLDTYAAMRDDINPKPRLRLIDEWARRARPEETRGLVARAMVDPDESVRERAQILFDRSMSAH